MPEPSPRPALFAPGAHAGRRVVLAGADNAIGRAIALRLGSLGARLALGGADAGALADCAAALRAAGAGAPWTGPVQLAHADEAARWVDAAWAALGGCDLLVNATARRAPARALDMRLEDWRAVVDTNFSGAWHLVLPMAQRWRDSAAPGTIVSVIAPFQRGMPGAANEGAAAAGVLYMTKTIAVEWAAYRIRANCVAAGVLAGSENQPWPPGDAAAIAEANPMRRAGTLDDVADAVAFLGSDAAGFVTGDLLTVDGGGVLWGETWPVAKPDFFKVRT
ncbi:MAG: SDR family oxidoreductase [Burkholderiales bacterium]|nr:SDR family oxidoreductase [Burkholderiales bacterium]